MEESLGFYLKVLVQWKIGNSYGSNERLLKALRVNNEEVLSVEKIWISSTNFHTLGGTLGGSHKGLLLSG